MRSAFLALSMGLVVFATPVLADEANGVMMVVKGDIKVTAGNGGKTEPARVGRKVFSGDTIIAGADSRAKIVMSDKNILNISPDSKMTIEKYLQNAANGGGGGQVELKVEYGKVRATVEQKYDGEKSKFNIKTPTAVAGVRGTDFITGFNQTTRQSSIVTFSGTVAVGTPGPNGSIQNAVFVKPGQQTNVGAGKAPEAPSAVPKNELNNMNHESSADVAKGGGGNGGGGDRSPASTGDGGKGDGKGDAKDGAKSDGAAKSDGGNKSDAGSKNGGNAAGAANGPNPGSSMGPSAPMADTAGPSSMFKPSDMDPAKNQPEPPKAPGPLLTPVMPTIVTVPTPVPTPPAAIKNGKSRVSITIN